jgi:sugar lactone lactonase YvrE
VRIPVAVDGSAGDASVLAEDPSLHGADGIAVDAWGALYVATFFQNEIVRVDPSNGEVTVVASGPMFHLPAGVRFSPDFETLYATNSEAFVFFGLASGPAHTGLLAIQVDGLGQMSELPEPPGAPDMALKPPSTGSGGLANPVTEGVSNWFIAIGAIALVGIAGATFSRWRCGRGGVQD